MASKKHKRRHILKHKETFSKALFALLVAFAVVLLWRGTWGLLDVYLFPDNLTLSYLLSAVLGVVLLYGTHYIFKLLNR